MRTRRHVVWSLAALAFGVRGSFADTKAAATAYVTREVPLPGAGPDGILMDYLAFDARTGLVWAPAGNTGAVDVVDTTTGKVTQIGGFATAAVERGGHARVVGPSSASVGDGVVYVGNRADSTVCAIDARTLHKGGCGKLDTMPDGVVWVAPTREVWVTTPRTRSIHILDGQTLAVKQTLTFDGDPEGYAVDAVRGRFYTNLEDKDRTLAIDVRSRRTVATWLPGCGDDGPRGLALDAPRGLLFVACTAGAAVLDAAHDGKVLSRLATGAGVDNLDYAEGRRELYVGAARAATLSVARVGDQGQLELVATVPTRPGARNGVVAANGDVVLAVSPASELLVASRKAP